MNRENSCGESQHGFTQPLQTRAPLAKETLHAQYRRHMHSRRYGGSELHYSGHKINANMFPRDRVKCYLIMR